MLLGQELGGDRCDKPVGLRDHVARVSELNGACLVVRDDTDFLGSFEHPAQFPADRPMLYQMQTENSNQAAMGLADLWWYGCAGYQESCAGCIEHGLVRAIAGAIDVAKIKQGLRRAAGTDGFHQQCLRRQVATQRLTPSAAMFCKRRGFE